MKESKIGPRAESRIEVEIKKTSKGHTIYYIDGKKIPGCSTVVGVMNKPALVYWANKLGLEGINSATYVDKLAKAGTLAHKLVENFYRRKPTNTDNYSKNEIDAANISFGKFRSWQEQNLFIPIDIELHLVSKKHKYGGTLDLYGLLGGKRTLLDIKTAKAVYKDHYTQVAGGYRTLLLENDKPVDEVSILRLGRSEEEGFQCVPITPEEVLLHEQRFLICRNLYRINELIGR